MRLLAPFRGVGRAARAFADYARVQASLGQHRRAAREAVSRALGQLLEGVEDGRQWFDRITSYYQDGLRWPGAEPAMPVQGYTQAGGQEWCGAFVAWCYEGSGLALARRRATASTYKLHDRCSDRRVWFRGEIDTLRCLPGDVLVVATSRGKRYGDHIAMVVEHRRGHGILTVEGNAHGAQLVQREAAAIRTEGVVLRHRAVDEVVAVYRWQPEDYTEA